MDKYISLPERIRLGQKVETKTSLARYRTATGAGDLNLSGKVIRLKPRSRIIYDPEPEVVVKTEEGEIRTVPSFELQKYSRGLETMSSTGDRVTCVSIKQLLDSIN